MDLYERILTKDEITKRFHMAVTAILSKGLMPNKTALADSLKVKPAKFSEILNGRMKVGVDMIAIMCDCYHVSPDWILMSRGNNVFRTSELPKYWIEDGDLNTSLHIDIVNDNTKQNSDSSVAPFLDLIREKDERIRMQAEEIGRLKAYIDQLEDKKRKSVSDVQTSGIANAGQCPSKL